MVNLELQHKSADHKDKGREKSMIMNTFYEHTEEISMLPK